MTVEEVSRVREEAMEALKRLPASALRTVARKLGVAPSFYKPGVGSMYLKSETLRLRIEQTVAADTNQEMGWANLRECIKDAGRTIKAEPIPYPVPTPDAVTVGIDTAAGEQREKAVETEELLRTLIEKFSPKQSALVDEEKVRVIVREALAAQGPLKHEIKIGGRPTVQIEGFLHERFDDVLKRATARVPVLMVGPAGSGKTTLGEQVSKALNLPFYFVSVSAGMSEGILGGRLLPIGEQARFEYVISEFIKAYEQGGVFLMDEADAGDANVMVKINSALANGHMAVDNRPSAPVAKKHPDFVMLAAANTFGLGADRVYVGRNQLDAATLDRFVVGQVEIGYDTRLEAKVAPQHICDWGWKVREAIQSHGLRRILSTRTLVNIGKLESAGVTKRSWTESYFNGWKQDELAKIPSSLR